MSRAVTSHEAIEDPDAAAGAPPSPASRKTLWVWLSLFLLLAILVYTLPVGYWLVGLSRTVEGLGVWGPVAFIAIYAATTVLLVPGTILSATAGMIFDPGFGVLWASIGSTIGAGLAFLIGRYLAREAVEEWMGKRKRFHAVDDAVAEEGWKIVFLLRLSPLFPFNFINYAFGVTKVGFGTYLTASLLGTLPGTALYVFGGSAAATALTRTGLSWSHLVGIVAVLLGTVWAARAVARALRKVQ